MFNNYITKTQRYLYKYVGNFEEMWFYSYADYMLWWMWERDTIL